MSKTTLPLILMVLLTLASPAARADGYERKADEAAAANLVSITIFVDSDWGAREDGAARELNRAHRAFGQRGYRVVDVESYVENGDLQGFFVTYALR